MKNIGLRYAIYSLAFVLMASAAYSENIPSVEIVSDAAIERVDDIEAEKQVNALADDVFDKEFDAVVPPLEALKAKYGVVVVTAEADKSFSLTFSVPYTEVETMLKIVVETGWYPTNLSIMGASDEKAAIAMMISENKNDSARRFRVLQKLSNPGVLPWKTSKLDDKTAYVTSIETDFEKDFLIKGETLKSGLIFTELTPRISKLGADNDNLDSERFRDRKTFDSRKMFIRETYQDDDSGINGQPFFERGTYKEDPDIGRYMIFTLRCQW